MGSMHCIINPVGRDGSTGKRWPTILSKLESKGWEVTAHMTERVGHATEIAWRLRQENEGLAEKPLIVAVGGDGTVHEVASALRESEFTLGIIPTGSGNDLAMAHGLHRKNLELSIETLSTGVDRSVGALRLEGLPAPAVKGYPSPVSRECDGPSEKEGNVVRWVFLESDGGVTSMTSRAKLTRGKWIRGSLKYTYLGLTEVLRWKKKMAWVKIDDEEPMKGDLSVMAFTMSETFGGGYRVCPGADPTNPHGHLIIGFNLSKLKMIRLMGPLRKGTHIGRYNIEYRNAKRLEIRALGEDGEISDGPHSPTLYIQADGEPCIQTPATLTFQPRQLKVRGAKVVAWESSE